MSETQRPPEFRLLGPLEVRVDGEPVGLGGPKQRAVLAVLLLSANEIVPMERLLDEVWEESPPPRARHTVEVYVSRLRAALRRAGERVHLTSRPPGYVLGVEPERVDVVRFTRLVEEARAARGAGEDRRASELLREGLALWRGDALADLQLGPGARARAGQLDELRLDAVEDWAAAELALGRPAAVVAELEELVARHPFRESLRAALMLALYRSGRRAAALDVYHSGRRAFGDELGLEPGLDVQRLAGQIIRQEPALDVAPVGPGATTVEARPRRRSRRWLLAVPAVVAAAGLTAVVLAGTFGNAADPAPRARSRIAVVMPAALGGTDDFPLSPPVWKGVEEAAREYGVDARLIDSGARPDDWRRALERTVRGGFDLVIVGLSASGPALADVAARHPAQRFAFLDGSSAEVGHLPNVTGVVFAEQEAGYLAGYLAGLVERTHGARLNARAVVSTVGAVPVPSVERYLGGFRAGVTRAFPGARILGGYSENFVAQDRCGRLANRQIERGSDIVFAVAGPCSFGALSVAGDHGVWALGVDGDLSYLGPHILASAIKRLDRAVLLAVRWFVQGRLKGGSDIVLDLKANGVGLAGINSAVPRSVRDALAEIDAEIRAGRIAVPPR